MIASAPFPGMTALHLRGRRRADGIPRRGPSHTFKIGLLLSESTGYGRGVLQGIAAFAEDHPECTFRVEAPNGKGIAILRA
jgi:hypothetical protein